MVSIALNTSPKEFHCYFIATLISLYIKFYIKKTSRQCGGLWTSNLRGCIRKFPDRVKHDIYAYVWYYSLLSPWKSYGGKTHYTDS